MIDIAARQVQTPSLAHVLRQTMAGVSVAVVGLPICLAAGMLAFAPLGGDWLGRGALAAIYAAIFSGLAATLFSRPSAAVTSPRASICLVQASLAVTLLSRPQYANDPAAVLVLMSLALVVSGVAQTLLGAFRVVRLVQVAPQPVFAGFLNGVALLIVGRQILMVTDRRDLGDLLLHAPSSAAIYPVAFVAAFVALGLVVPRFFRPVPAPVVNLVLGLALFYAVSPFLPAGVLGASLSLPPSSLSTGFIDIAAIGATLSDVSALVLLDVVTHGLTLAFVGIIETLMTLRLAETISHRRVGREDGILGQGIANIIGAAFAVPSCAGPTQTTVNWLSGGRGRLPQILSCSILAALLLFGHDVIGFVPVAVLAGHLILIAIAMVDRWSVRQLRRAMGEGDKRARRVAVRNVVVMLVVTVTTGTGHVVLGAAVGFLIAFAMFISDSASPMIRARMRGDIALSRRVRPLAELSYLRSGGARKLVLSLQGPIYFGNVVDLAREVDAVAGTVDYVVLDFRRVTSIDASAVATLEHLLRAAWSEGRTVFICSVAADLLFMLDDLPRPSSGQPLIFEDRDQALEWCEDQRLADAPVRVGSGGVADLEAMDVARDLSPEQVDLLRRHLVAARYADGEFLCREGDDGNVIWLILAGDIQVRVSVGGSTMLRLGTYGPGTLLGEVAFIEGVRRSASLIADGEVSALTLTRFAFESLAREDAALGLALMRNITRVLSERLRLTTDQLRTAEHV